MKIVFMGTPEFACPPLEQLYHSRHELLAVVTTPDKPAGRGKKITASEVCMSATNLGVPIVKPESLKDDRLFEQLKQLAPDLIVVVAFRLLPRRLYELPKLGAINIHASLLPKYRGAAPIQWALINGESETGLTAFYLKKQVDTGDIILQKRVPIENTDNYDSLYRRLAGLAGSFLLETLDQIENGEAQPKQQSDTEATNAPKIGPFDALIDFGFPASNVRNFIRGLSTKPGAYTYFREKKVKILSSEIADNHADPQTRPGTITRAKKQLVVQCARTALELTCLIPEGKKPMDGCSFINGFRPKEGELFGETTHGERIAQ
jgi:methionyl-tRNA formyltransferase